MDPQMLCCNDNEKYATMLVERMQVKRCSDLASRSEMQIEHGMNKTREVSELNEKKGGIGRKVGNEMGEMKEKERGGELMYAELKVRF